MSQHWSCPPSQSLWPIIKWVAFDCCFLWNRSWFCSNLDVRWLVVRVVLDIFYGDAQRRLHCSEEESEMDTYRRMGASCFFWGGFPNIMLTAWPHRQCNFSDSYFLRDLGHTTGSNSLHICLPWVSKQKEKTSLWLSFYTQRARSSVKTRDRLARSMLTKWELCVLCALISWFIAYMLFF